MTTIEFQIAHHLMSSARFRGKWQKLSNCIKCHSELISFGTWNSWLTRLKRGARFHSRKTAASYRGCFLARRVQPLPEISIGYPMGFTWVVLKADNTRIEFCSDHSANFKPWTIFNVTCQIILTSNARLLLMMTEKKWDYRSSTLHVEPVRS